MREAVQERHALIMTLIAMAGLPGTGKTTLAHALIKAMSVNGDQAAEMERPKSIRLFSIKTLYGLRFSPPQLD